MRLDAAVVSRGLARSRTHAAHLIAAGLVTVDGTAVVKASTNVADDQQIAVAEADQWVSRAAHKLIAALDAFDLDVVGRTALDVGASTGGFTQVLLVRGATHVIAVDVGHDQLSSEIQENPAVTSIEGFNIREITRDWLRGMLRTPDMTIEIVRTSRRGEARPWTAEFPMVVVADLSFISLRLVLEPLLAAVGSAADFVLLVKPQFEVGRTGINEGIVRAAHLRADAVNGVLWAAWDLGLPTAGMVASPIAGARGNREYLVWLNVARGRNPSEWSDEVTRMTDAS